MNETTETIENKKRGRKQIYENGVRSHERETKYHSQYYHKTNKNIECPICNKQTTSRTLKQHQESLQCQKSKIKNEGFTPEIEKKEINKLILKNKLKQLPINDDELEKFLKN
jgi:ribosomal protein L37AE/L43A